MPNEITYEDITGWDQDSNSTGKTFILKACRELIRTGAMGGHPELPNGCAVLLARHGRKIVGCMVYTYAHDLNGIYLHVAYVDPGYQRMGIFTCMVTIMKEKAKTLNIPHVYWEVAEQNEDVRRLSERLAIPSMVRYVTEA